LPLGALNKYIQDNPKMPWSERFSSACDVAEGMMFLHSKVLANGKTKPELFHQDLKSANILLLRDDKNHLRAKIADVRGPFIVGT
jgi:serine/threonine protein kinase